MQEKIKTAICSYGMSGQVFHGPLLKANPDYEVVSILERSKNNALQHFDKNQIVRSYEKIINNEAIDLVIVNTPDHLHLSMAREALLAGKHVVVEKPFVYKYDEALDLIELARSVGKKITVFQNRRWDSDFLTVREVLKSKKLGRVVEFEAHFDRFRNFVREGSWKEDSNTGTGTLYNLGSHLIDQALVLFGNPRAVTARLHKLRNGSKVDDAFEIWLHYKKIRVTLKSSYLTKEPGPKYLLHGTMGSYVKYGEDIQEKDLKSGKLPGYNEWGIEPRENQGIIHFERNGKDNREEVVSERGNYPFFYHQLADALNNNNDLPVEADEAAKVIKTIEKCIMSDKSGRQVEF
jgi:predicted dehydrogenase